MKQKTPDEERQCIVDSSETWNFKFIYQKIEDYRRFSIDDVIVDEETKVKYKITYIDNDFRLLYGRRVCVSGALSKNIHHITSMHTTFIPDADQINAVLLGEQYDPAAKAKEISRRKREAYKQRLKQRKKLSRDESKARAWCATHLNVGQTVWITGDQFEDREANDHKYIVHSKSNSRLLLTDTRSGKACSVDYEDLHKYNIYRTLPIVYREMP